MSKLTHANVLVVANICKKRILETNLAVKLLQTTVKFLSEHCSVGEIKKNKMHFPHFERHHIQHHSLVVYTFNESEAQS